MTPTSRLRVESMPPMGQPRYKSREELEAYLTVLRSRDPKELAKLVEQWGESGFVKVAIANNPATDHETLIALATDNNIGVQVPAVQGLKARGLRMPKTIAIANQYFSIATNDDTTDRELRVLAQRPNMAVLEVVVGHENASPETVQLAVETALRSDEIDRMALYVLYEALKSGKTTLKTEKKMADHVSKILHSKKASTRGMEQAEEIYLILLNIAEIRSDSELACHLLRP